MKLDDDNEQLIETIFRNGTLTVVGIVLSFSLGFLTRWANNPLPWQLIDLPTIVLLSAGIIYQLAALFGLLQPSALEKNKFNRANRHFINGIIMTAAGTIAAVVIDFIQLVTK